MQTFFQNETVNLSVGLKESRRNGFDCDGDELFQAAKEYRDLLSEDRSCSPKATARVDAPLSVICTSVWPAHR